MKKFLALSVFFGMISTISAQTVSCVSITTNLQRGAESSAVLSLQNFLYAKGLLKATPNGYFGAGTLAGVKAYQKSVGLLQVGNTGPATRAAIKKDSCSQPASQAPTTANPQATSTSGSAVSVTAVVPQNMPLPTLNSLDLVTLFSGGTTDWGFNLYGTHFSTTTNTVYFKNTATRKIYTIGIFASSDGMTIALPKNLTATAFPCGSYCNEIMPAGPYEISVATAGGQTDARTITMQSFTYTAQTAAVQGPLPASATHQKFGILTFSSSAPVTLRSVNLIASSSTIPSIGYGNAVLVDPATGLSITDTGVDMSLSPFQSRIYNAYVDTSNTTAPGTVTAHFTVTVEDYIGKKDTTFTTPDFLATIDGIL
jgi:peptidoglycan hydrolase-like protein with peptidoglycan-binding domain